MAVSTGSLAVFAAAVEDAPLSPAALARGMPASCATRNQHAAARSSSFPRKPTFPRFLEDSNVVMKGELPVPLLMKECLTASNEHRNRVCPTGLLRAIHVLPKRSPAFNRAPLANSEAETCLRPSTFTATTRKTVASPHMTNNSFFSPDKVPGATPVPCAGRPAPTPLDTGSTKTWHVCPRKVV